MAASKQAYTHFHKCSHASVGLTQARPNYPICSGLNQPAYFMDSLVPRLALRANEKWKGKGRAW